MAARHDLPIYNLKAVVQETGIKPDTLRAWERRYGLPEPQRTASGHRLYTDRDVATLKWLVARQDDGLTISRAVALSLASSTGERSLEHVVTETRPGETSRMPISQSMPSKNVEYNNSAPAAMDRGVSSRRSATQNRR